MSVEDTIYVAACLVFGLSLVLFPRPIAAWFCRYMTDLWRLHDRNFFARGLESAAWVIEQVSLGRVHDQATAPKAFRFLGFCYLFIAVNIWFVSKL